MIATGLHQDPHPELTYYWRLRKHAELLNGHRIPFALVEPKMSRDFHLRCNSSIEAAHAEALLNSMHDAKGVRLFAVDNSGSDLFVMLAYPHDIRENFEYTTAAGLARNLRNDVAFVAIKNGQHNGVGYFVDSGRKAHEHVSTFHFSELPEKVKAAVLG